jgi:hypothetical protein
MLYFGIFMSFLRRKSLDMYPVINNNKVISYMKLSNQLLLYLLEDALRLIWLKNDAKIVPFSTSSTA